jgi:flagellin-specific chaperone FliS
MTRTYREIAEELVAIRIRLNLEGIRNVEEQIENLKKRWGPE